MSNIDVRDVDFGELRVVYLKPENSDNEICPSSAKANADWQPEPTSEFLKILHKQMIHYKEGKVGSKRNLFLNCSKQLKNLGYFYTHMQCENKWKALKRRFYNNQMYMHKMRSIDKKQMYFDEVENILKIDKPSYLEEIEEINKRKQKEQLEQTLQYTGNEEKIVEMVLDEPNDDEMIVERLSDYEPQISKQTVEIDKLETSIKQHIEKTDVMFEAVSNNQVEILDFLKTIDKKDKEKLQMKKKKLAVKEQLVQQTKIQNSLIAKLVQKIGTSGSFNGLK